MSGTVGPIIKPTPDRDEYVLWSLISEGPVFVGTRAQMLDYLGPGQVCNPTETRLVCADAFGTSRIDGQGGWGDYFVFDQRGLIDCRLLGELARRLVAGEKDAALDLCRPFDDESEVRRG